MAKYKIPNASKLKNIGTGWGGEAPVPGKQPERAAVYKIPDASKLKNIGTGWGGEAPVKKTNKRK